MVAAEDQMEADRERMRSLQFADEIEFSYARGGRDWYLLVEDAELCQQGLEQSPIDLMVEDVSISESMELNGYEYVDFDVDR